MAFEPKILGFLCNWCSYAGSDLAGTSRIQYPPSLRVIRVMCTARMDPVFILKAFAEGADGVLVSGCHPGDCHYVSGNYKAKRRVGLVHELLESIGIEKERLMLKWVSASEAERFANVVKEFTNKIKEIGPSPLRQEVKQRAQ
jgi:F420-non-reducing hydrogenase iron-sulfur subunit